MKKDISLKALEVILFTALYIILLIVFSGCRTVKDVAKNDVVTTTDSATVAVAKTETTETDIYNRINQQLREIIKEYAPGYVAPYIVAGETTYVQLPPQIIRETIREKGKQEIFNYNNKVEVDYDSLAAIVEKHMADKTKTKAVRRTNYSPAIWVMVLLILAGGFIFYFQQNKKLLP